MIIPIADLIAGLRAEPKFYVASGICPQTFFNVLAGRPVSLPIACKFLALARERDPRSSGLRLADGTVISNDDAMAQVVAERDMDRQSNEQLVARIRQLEAQVRALEARRFRDLVNEGRARLLDHPTHSRE